MSPEPAFQMMLLCAFVCGFTTLITMEEVFQGNCHVSNGANDA